MTAALRHPIAVPSQQSAAGPLGPKHTDPAAGELAKIKRALATMPALGDQINHLSHQIERFEDMSTDIERWLDRHSIGHWGNPFAPWSDDSALYVRLRLGAMHAALVGKIKAMKDEAMTVLAAAE